MEHLDRIKKIPDLIEPKIGEVAKAYLGELFISKIEYKKASEIIKINNVKGIERIWLT